MAMYMYRSMELYETTFLCFPLLGGWHIFRKTCSSQILYKYWDDNAVCRHKNIVSLFAFGSWPPELEWLIQNLEIPDSEKLGGGAFGVRPLLRVVAATQHVSTHILHLLSLVRLLTPLLHHISQHQAVFFGGCWIGLIFEVLTIPYTWHIGFQFWPSFGLRLSYHRGKAKLYFSKFFKPKQIEFLGFKIISQSWNWTLGELFLSGLMLVQPPLSDRENKNILRRHLQSNSAQFFIFFLS